MSRFFVILFGMVAMVGGGHGLYVGVTNLRPTTLTAEEYIRTKPSAKWLHLTEASIDMHRATYESFLGLGRAKQVYVPIVARDDHGGGDIHMLLHTDDSALIDLVNEIRKLPSEEAYLAFMMDNAGHMVAERKVEGLVRHGLNFRSSDKRALRNKQPDLAKKFIVIDEGGRPEPFGYALMFFFGILIMFFCIRSMVRRVATPPPLPPPTQGSPPPPLPAHAA